MIASDSLLSVGWLLLCYQTCIISSIFVGVPELPGRMADDIIYEEAVKNAQVIIDEWIKTARKLGREIPKPKED